MVAARGIERLQALPRMAAAGAAMLFALGGSASALASTNDLLAATPLILKDGRIAEVSVHVLGFEDRNANLASDTNTRLDQLVAEAATDCFLTAQVIGHVGPAEISDGNTLGAHRLARARADAVQASLIDGGLPANAIASVWDWQFMVREARATLWVFRLIPGEDCDGAPLGGGAGQLVAQAPATEKTKSAERTKTAEKSKTAPSSPSRPSEVAKAATGGGEATAAAAPPRPARSPETAKATSGGDEATTATADAPSSAPEVTRSLPAVDPDPPADERQVVAARAPKQPQSPTQIVAARAKAARAQDAQSGGKVAEAGDDAVVITFATNSSYFPRGTRQRLNALLDRLEDGERYRIEVQAGISGSDRVVGAKSPEEAARYNRWLAERRVERVETWLKGRASGDAVVIEPRYREDDDSRQVLVRAVPAA